MARHLEDNSRAPDTIQRKQSLNIKLEAANNTAKEEVCHH